MPEKTQQFAQNIARSLIGKEAAHPAQPLIQMQGIRKSYYICLLYTSPSPRDRG